MRLLLTRPAVDSAPLAAKLHDLGHRTVISPLLDIHYHASGPLDLKDVQAVLFTSANGVRAWSGVMASDTENLPALCVGAQTGQVAREAGFQDVRIAGGDVTDLADLALLTCRPAAGALLHIAGTKVAGDLAGLLTKAGFAYRRAVLYEAVTPDALSETATAALLAGTLDGVLLYSPRTAETFRRVIAAQRLHDATQGLTAFCLSHNVAAALDGLALAAIRIASKPDGQSLLHLLTQE